MDARTLADEHAGIRRETLRLAAIRRRVGPQGTPEEESELAERSAALRTRLAQHLVSRMIENRPPVTTRGRPVSGEAAHRGLAEARARLEGRPSVSRCPAADVSPAVDGGTQVRCAVEQTTLSSRTDPQSVLTFCLGAHEQCPSWQLERERVWSGRTEPLVEAE